MKTKKTKKTRRATKQDATIRNVRAAKKRTKTLEQRIRKLELAVATLRSDLLLD